MDAKQAREELLAIRERFDRGAKKIVDALNNESDAQEIEDRITEAITATRGKMLEVYEAELATPVERMIAAFEQWEIMERRPLHEDETFMIALRTVTRNGSWHSVKEILDRGIDASR
jgi:hypothetical protein